MKRLWFLSSLIVVFAGSASAQAPARGEALETIVAVLSMDPSPRVRAQAALALRPRATEAAASLQAALRDESPVVRAAAARALADAAPQSALADLLEASRDDDALVCRWARAATCRLLGRADRVQFEVRRMAARVAAPADWSDKVFQEEILTALLVSSRFDVARALDFGDEAPAADDLVVRDWHLGPVFAPPEAPPLPSPVPAALRGQADVVERSSEGVRVRAELTLESMTGTLLWRGDATAWGRPPVDGEPGSAEAGDLAALRTAARTVARLLLGALSPGPVLDPDPEPRIRNSRDGRP
jgi:hypothetical protein